MESSQCNNTNRKKTYKIKKFGSSRHGSVVDESD